MPQMVSTLSEHVRPTEADDRRTFAALLAGHSGDTGASRAARALLADPDPSVRAEAAWAMGSLGDASLIQELVSMGKGHGVDGGINAVAAIARIFAGSPAKPNAAATLCPFLTDLRPYVRANALVGLALSGARCGDGSSERRVLALDSSDL